MRLRSLILFVLVMAASLGGVAVLAQDTSPHDANACDAGGVWEGQCDWPTEAEREWAWTCGWYIAGYGQGAVTEIPAWCHYGVSLAPINLTCFDSPNPSWSDMKIIGPPNMLNNVEFYHTNNGTCNAIIPDNHRFFLVTVAGTPSELEINLVCSAVSLGATSYNVTSPFAIYFPAVPANLFLCEI